MAKSEGGNIGGTSEHGEYIGGGLWAGGGGKRDTRQMPRVREADTKEVEKQEMQNIRKGKSSKAKHKLIETFSIKLKELMGQG